MRIIKGKGMYTGHDIMISQTGNLRFQHEYLLAAGESTCCFLAGFSPNRPTDNRIRHETKERAMRNTA